MTQSVEDGATRPIYYESRVMSLELDKDVLQKIDETYSRMEEMDEVDPAVIEKSKHDLGQLEAVLGNPATIDSLVKDILHHYEKKVS